jgi:hypothetical protein
MKNKYDTIQKPAIWASSEGTSILYLQNQLTTVWTLLLFYPCSFYISLITGSHDEKTSVPLYMETHAINSWKESFICSAIATQALQDNWLSDNVC